MKVLHVTDTDLPARRFNGYDLLAALETRGITGHQAVLRKLSANPRVFSLFDGRGDELLQRSLARVERERSLNNLLVPWGRVLKDRPEFRDTDVVHYHLIHNQVISLYDLTALARMKPSVWTFHDPWPLTGHCVHPMGWDGWLQGCSPCPFLDRLFPLATDRADRMWRLKRRLFSELDIDIVVASRWMLDMVQRSPMFDSLERIHLIPFGIDSRSLGGTGEKGKSRQQLGIAQDDFVILVRASAWEVKGLRYLIEALAMRRPQRRTTVVAVDGRNLLNDLRHSYTIRDFGWVTNAEVYSRVFQACDVFVMPSLAEAFGLMALEAMAAERPVLCFDGTAVPEVTHAPECGMAVPAGNAVALREALDHLAENPAEGARRGRLGRSIVAAEYSQDQYLNSIVDLYQSALHRNSTN